jgi:hypothetical protein
LIAWRSRRPELALVPGQHDVSGLVQEGPHPPVPAFRYAAEVVDLARLIPPWNQARISANVSLATDAGRIVDRSHKGERGQLADAQVCRITSLDGQEVASVGRVPGPRSGRLNQPVYSGAVIPLAETGAFSSFAFASAGLALGDGALPLSAKTLCAEVMSATVAIICSSRMSFRLMGHRRLAPQRPKEQVENDQPISAQLRRAKESGRGGARRLRGTFPGEVGRYPLARLCKLQ